MNASRRIILAGALLGTLGLGGLATKTVLVKPSPVAVIPQPQSTYKVAEAPGGDGDGETNDDAREQEESSRLQSQAKISPQQAQQTAEKAVGGQVSRIRLENENGNLVYSVLVGEKDVKVDAGNGKVLYTDNPKAEGNEGSRPRSSIRVSEGANGDGDGETNDDG